MVASHELRQKRREAQGASRELFVLPSPMQAAPQTRASRLAPRAFRGVSLLEVLISMFVLLFGLMGVAAIFPVGNHYAARSDQLDRGSGLAEAALSELKTRGMLRPRVWRYADYSMGTTSGGSEFLTPLDPNVVATDLAVFNMPPATSLSGGSSGNLGPGYAFVLDPLGAAPPVPGGNPLADSDVFPYFDTVFDQVNTVMPAEWKRTGALPGLLGSRWPIRRLTLLDTSGHMSAVTASTIFRLHDDLTNTLPEANDRPGQQRWTTLNNGTPDNPYDDIALARDYAGSYSWFATILPTSNADANFDFVPDAIAGLQPSNPRFGSFQYEVSVAVVYKRDGAPAADTERMLQAELGPGGDLIMYAATGNGSGADFNAMEAAMQDIRAGQWALVAGVHPGTGQFLMKWYRLLAVDADTDDSGVNVYGATRDAVRHAMLENVEAEDPFIRTSNTTGNTRGLRVILMPDVIGVATQTLELETD